MEQISVGEIVGDLTDGWLISAIESLGRRQAGLQLATVVLLDCLAAKPAEWFDEHDAWIGIVGEDLQFDECQLTVTVGEVKREECLSQLVRPVRDSLEDGLCGTWDDDDVSITVLGNQLALEPRVSEFGPDKFDIDYEQCLKDFCSSLAFLALECRAEGGLDLGSDSALAARATAFSSLRSLLVVVVSMCQTGLLAIPERDEDDPIKGLTHYLPGVIMVCSDWQRLPRSEVHEMLADAEELRPDEDLRMFREALETWPY